MSDAPSTTLPETPMVERLAAALKAHLAGGEDDVGDPYVRVTDPIGSTMVDGYVDFNDLARAAIAAMREPTEAMTTAVEFLKYGEPVEGYAVNVNAFYTAMMDAALLKPAE